jgi:hypothetical protein
MRDLLILAIHLLVTFAKLLRPGGVRAIVAESLALKHQLLMESSGGDPGDTVRPAALAEPDLESYPIRLPA